MRSPPGSLLEQTSRLVVRRQIQLRRRARRALGHLGVGLQRARPRPHLPVLDLRRARARAQARPRRGPRRRALRDGARGDGRSDGGRAELRAPRRSRRARGATASTRRSTTRPSRLPEGETRGRRPRVHGAPPGHVDRRARQRRCTTGAMRTALPRRADVQATELLLQERTPRDVAVARPRVEEVETRPHVRDVVAAGAAALHVAARSDAAHAPALERPLRGDGHGRGLGLQPLGGPRRHALARGRDARRLGHLRLPARRPGGRGLVGRATSRRGVEAGRYEVAYSEDRAEIHRRDGTIATTLEVVVSPEDDAEVRRVTLTNLGARAREIELTSYAEIVLAPPGRRRRAPGVLEPVRPDRVRARRSGRSSRRGARARRTSRRSWAAHVVAVEGETRRRRCSTRPTGARFLGRGRDIRDAGRPSSTAARSRTRSGAVLDPIFSLRRRVRLAPGRRRASPSRRWSPPTRDEALDLADKYRDPATFDRVVTLAWTQAQVQLRHLGIDARRGAPLPAARQPHPLLRPDPARAAGGPRAQPRGRSRALGARHLGRPADRARAHRRGRGPGDRPPAPARARVLAAEAASPSTSSSLNEQALVVRHDLQATLEALVRASRSARPATHRAGGARAGSSCCAPTCCARGARRCSWRRRAPCSLARRGTLARAGRPRPAARRPRVRPPRRAAPPQRRADRARCRARSSSSSTASAASPTDGREYVTVLGEGQWTPAPWINVVANPGSASWSPSPGRGYTWSDNSRENQLTPWSNDPVTDPPGEALYLRDEETGELWTPTPLPIREDGSVRRPPRPGLQPLRARHAHGIALELVAVRAARRPGQDLAADAREPRRRAPTAALGHGLRRVGARRDARERRRALRRHRDRRGDRARSSRATPGTPTSPERVAFADLGGRAGRVDRPTAPSSSAATARSRVPRRCAPASDALGTRRRGARSLRRAADDASSSRPGEQPRRRVPARAEAATRRRRAR